MLPGKRPPAGWPGRGQLVVRDLSVRYRAGLAPVLRGVSFRVEAGQKVRVSVSREGKGMSCGRARQRGWWWTARGRS